MRNNCSQSWSPSASSVVVDPSMSVNSTVVSLAVGCPPSGTSDSAISAVILYASAFSRNDPPSGCTLAPVRPLRYSINITLDGCCDHRAGATDEERHRHAEKNIARADALIFGRETYQVKEAARRP